MPDDTRTIAILRKQLEAKDAQRDRTVKRHHDELAALAQMTLVGHLRLWMRARQIANWRCRCGRRLGADSQGCGWHSSVRAQAIAGLITEDEAR